MKKNVLEVQQKSAKSGIACEPTGQAAVSKPNRSRPYGRPRRMAAGYGLSLFPCDPFHPKILLLLPLGLSDFRLKQACPVGTIIIIMHLLTLHMFNFE